MNEGIAVVGMACRYPDAASPAELWENCLARRRAFRRMPPERLSLDDYPGEDVDGVYCTQAALLKDYAFDRMRFRVTGSSFRSADMAHWLALEVASEALTDAGFPDGRGLPRETAGVLLGNTLTGDQSRANLMRLRWPYVRRVTAATLTEQGWEGDRLEALLTRLESAYKAPFPPMDEESLAGGLSNTIAGRICNHFDLRGGGYTLDGACSSSLLALAQACSALAAGDLDLAIAGGVDLSLDPFELVGFSRIGALSRTQMRVYDRRADGFWPGEGCGLLVLMRRPDALARGLRCYGLIRGWGISSDGAGGITRPEVEGQRLALERAYRRAGYPAGEVSLFEGHGTGTNVGDTVELRALNAARRGASARAAVGSVKANIGHTKAAAGAAGLIKALMALHTQVLPPATGCAEPHAELTAPDSTLRLLEQGEPWPADQPLRAGVSGFGFGGIDCHLALEGVAAVRRRGLSDEDRRLLRSPQDTEIFFLQAPDPGALATQARALAAAAAGLAQAELTDLAAHLAAQPLGPAGPGGGPRAAVLAASPERLAARLMTLAEWLDGAVQRRLDPDEGVLLATPQAAPRIGLLFCGQSAPVRLDAGAMGRRFQVVADLYAGLRLAVRDDGGTAVAQPAIIAAERAALALLGALGLLDDPQTIALGHSLGEYAALHWAGALDGERLQALAGLRGRLMDEVPGPPGAMAAVQADGATVRALLPPGLVVSCFNSARQTVVSGEKGAVEGFSRRCRDQSLRVSRLPVAHAFHSPLMAPAVAQLGAALRAVPFGRLQGRVISTVTGAELAADADLPELLTRQMTASVRFTAAAAQLVEQTDLALELGPGQVLSTLLDELSPGFPVFPLDAAGKSLASFLLAVGAAFVLGAPVRREALFADRLCRPCDPARTPVFLGSPCEQAPSHARPLPRHPAVGTAPGTPVETAGPPTNRGDAALTGPHSHEPLEVLRAIVAAKAELPTAAVTDDSRLLIDLHLNSISVGQIVAEAARRLDLPPPAAPTDYADATLAAIAESLHEQQATGAHAGDGPQPFPAGVDQWVHPFRLTWLERPLPATDPARARAPQTGPWEFMAPVMADAPDLEALQLPDSGTLVWLPESDPSAEIALLLRAGRATLEARRGRFVLVQQGGAAAPLARTLKLEHPDLKVCVLDLAPDHRFGERVSAEVAAAAGYTEVRYDGAGRRLEPWLAPLEQAAPGGPGATGGGAPLGRDDVLLVSGGGKGIAAESALALARTHGVRLALLGRSDPDQDPGLAANLERLRALGVSCHYARADVTDAAAVARAVGECVAALGPITALLHGAGANQPRLLHELTPDDVAATLAPKVAGLEHLLAALDPGRLRLLVTFGSIIARSGMRGEADYALANEALARRTESFAARHPGCRCLCLEWSIWSGVGMGERLGRIDALLREGITPIAPAAGVALLAELLTRADLPVRLVVSGRLGALPTLRLPRAELPLGRFLETVRLHYPGLELVVEPELSLGTDPYLADHALAGEPLFPAVMGLEAMAQAAMALIGSERPPHFEAVEFLAPIAVPAERPLVIRIAALARDRESVEVVVRSAVDAFQQDRFRARCRFTHAASPPALECPVGPAPDLDPGPDLYEALLFHTGRFRRIRRYRSLSAWHCRAEIAAAAPADLWFAPYLPADLILGDPGSRDAGLHAIQACIPHERLLPVAVAHLQLVDPLVPGPWVATARETARDEARYFYDLELRGRDGTLREVWQGLCLRRIEPIGHALWPAALLVPHLQRRLETLMPGRRLSVILEHGGAETRANRGTHALAHALDGRGGEGATVLYRADGRPQSPTGRGVSVAHAGTLTLAVAGGGRLGCDLEPVVQRPEAVWADLLGSEHLMLARVLGQTLDEPLDDTATRVWCALECIKKDGTAFGGPLVLSHCEPDGWVLFAAGARRIACCKARVRGQDGDLVIAVLEGDGDASL